MEAEEILELFDSYWFEQGIFSNKQASSDSTTNPVHQNHQNTEKPYISIVPTLYIRSQSERCLSCKTSFNPEFLTTKLQTVLSGKEFEGIRDSAEKGIEKGGSRRSLSELEFQELKGFIDLGFIFSEEDMDSSLASIIPGLQRLGRVNGKKEENGDGKYGISRPYLSEVWGVTDQTKLKNPLMDWRSISDLRNKIDMKDHLRVWAQTVASRLRFEIHMGKLIVFNPGL